MLDKETLDQIRGIPILKVADRLQIKYTEKGTWRFTSCFLHEEKTPSLGIKPSQNRWKCFGCGAGGSQIDLVMKHEHKTFIEACEWLIGQFGIEVSQQEVRQTLIEAIKPKLMNTTNTQYLDPTLLERFKGTSNEFTRAMVQSGILTMEQMTHAAERYHLCTANEGVIFWQIDHENNLREGKVMYYEADGHRSHSRKPISMSWLLKKEHQLPNDWRASNCLFGLHLLKDDNDSIVAVVESEKTAIICSELLPTLKIPTQNTQNTQNTKHNTQNTTQVIWLATGGKNYLSTETLQPLRGRRVMIIPDTDTTGSTYQDWLKITTETSRQFGHPLTVTNFLEKAATPEQKQQKIDIADYLIYGKTRLQ